ncbi:MAG: hypothetical protein EOO89_31040, partial [Pedobacter sp.]
MPRSYIFFFALFILSKAGFSQSHENYSASLPATDALGRKLPSYGEVGNVKKDKFVGMFYWTWHYHQAQNKP